MKRSASPSCRHQAGRRGVDGCAAVPGVGRPWRPRRLALLFAVAALGWPSHNLARAACSNGLEGVESSGGDVCCVEGCGQCGGDGCSSIEGLAGVDCCTGDIMDSGVNCGDSNTAPCIIDDSTTTAPSPATGTLSPGAAPSQDLTPTASDSPTAAPQTSKPDTGSEAPATAPQTPTGPTTSQPSTASPQPPVASAPTGAPSGAAAPTAKPVAANAPSSPTALPTTSPPVATIGDTQAPLAAASSTCSNGYPGWQTNEACCSEFCGQCGGEGCGTLGSANCCHDNIISAGFVCGQDGIFEAPCIVDDDFSPTTPTPLAAGDTLPPSTPTAPPVSTQAPARPVTASPVVSRGLPTAPPAAPTPTPMPGTSAGETVMPVAPGETLAPQGATPSPQEDASTPPTQIEEETCSNNLPGYQHGVVCCPLSCGQCGGSGCENIAGTEGASDCCSDVILAGGAKCDSTAVAPVVAPCIVGTVDEVESANEAANAATGLRASGGGVGGTASAIGVACAVAAAAATTAARFVH